MGAHQTMTNTDHADTEIELVSHLISSVSNCGISEDRISVINLYVALKTKPLVILVGPPKSGKQALAQCVSQFLSGGGGDQCQVISGHPWWANPSDNLALLTDMHTRLLTEKLFALFEEAALPEHKDRMFTACLMHLSPAELLTFFREFAFQLRNGQLMRLGEVHLSAPFPYPSNLFLLGTMETVNFRWWDADLLAKATVIHWSDGKACPPTLYGFAPNTSEFLRYRIGSRQAAYQKLFAIVGGQKGLARIIFQIETLLWRNDICLPVSIKDEVVTYLANSWAANGQGLFDNSMTTNLTIALDLAVAQILLARIADHLMTTTGLNQQLGAILRSNFPVSTAFLENFV